MAPREKRIFQNEELFREVNARIAELEARVRIQDESMPLVCECANTGCATVIEVESAIFETVRASPLRFLVAPGHERADETVVERHAGYLIIEKHEPS